MGQPAVNDVLTWDGTKGVYTPNSSAPAALTNTYIFVGNSVNVATGVPLDLSATPGTFSLANTGVLTMPDATTLLRGLLSSTDWNTFNNKVTSVTGTSNRITSSGGATPVIDIASTYVGQTSITTLGVVTTGTLSTGAIIAGVTMTLGSDAANDVYYRNASGILTRLANGTTNQVLTATTGAAPSWATATAPLTQTQVGFGSVGNVMTSDPSFTYNVANTQLTLVGSSTGANGTLLISRGDSSNRYIMIDESASFPDVAFLGFRGTGATTATMGARFSAGSPISYVFSNTSQSDLVTIDIATGAMTLGIAGTRTGLLKMTGATSGTVTIQTAAAAGTWTMTLPVDDGASGQMLTTDGAGVTSWTTPGGGVTSVSGTANRITSSGGTTPVIDIAATYVGQTSLTTLGTVTTGTWTAAVIGPAYGGTGIANNAASTITISGNFATTITVSAITTVTLPTSGTLYGTLAGSISSAQMLSSMSDETGTGVLVFGTSPTFTTDITTPLIIGGTAVGSNIIYKSTSGTGTTTAVAHQFTGGTDGATVLSTQYNDGQFLVGTTTRILGSLGVFRVGLGTGFTDIGEISAGLGGIWFNKATPALTTYALTSNATNTTLNAPTNACLIAVAGVLKATFGVSTASFAPTAASSGAATVFTFTAPASTAQTASTEALGFAYSLTTSRQWATGALTTQREFLINAPTYRFVGASTITNAATFAIAAAPIAGTNATITNAHALWVQSGQSHFDGNIEMGDTYNVILNATTGTKIGTATSQKLGFWNVTPVIQPAGATQAALAAYATGVFGLDSNANMQALYDLVVAMRTALVNTGIIKGAA